MTPRHENLLHHGGVFNEECPLCPPPLLKYYLGFGAHFLSRPGQAVHRWKNIVAVLLLYICFNFLTDYVSETHYHTNLQAVQDKFKPATDKVDPCNLGKNP